MLFAHERLDVYQNAIEFVAWGQILWILFPLGRQPGPNSNVHQQAFH
jgi:hypothetical protein